MVAPYACLKRGRERFNPQKLGPTFGLWNVRLNPRKRLVMRNPKLRPSTLRSWRLDPVLSAEPQKRSEKLIETDITDSQWSGGDQIR